METLEDHLEKQRANLDAFYFGRNISFSSDPAAAAAGAAAAVEAAELAAEGAAAVRAFDQSGEKVMSVGADALEALAAAARARAASFALKQTSEEGLSPVPPVSMMSVVAAVGQLAEILPSTGVVEGFASATSARTQAAVRKVPALIAGETQVPSCVPHIRVTALYATPRTTRSHTQHPRVFVDFYAWCCRLTSVRMRLHTWAFSPTSLMMSGLAHRWSPGPFFHRRHRCPFLACPTVYAFRRR